MVNLTLSIDDKLLRRARIRALEQNTTVNTLVRSYLADFAGVGPTRQALDDFLALTSDVDASSGSSGRSWKRDELYER